ncbi:MAG: hypothetical protein ACFFA3_10045, partial [Promethearchaeota archaeon]
MNNLKKTYITLGIAFIICFCCFSSAQLNEKDGSKIEPKEIESPKTNGFITSLLHSYDFEGDTVGQDPSGVTLSVIEPVGSGTANIDNLADSQQNHVAVYKSGGTERVELRDNISYYGFSFDAGIFHCKIHHDDSLFGILFHDDLGVLFRLDWYDGIIGRWSPMTTYTYYNYSQWYDVVVYFNISLGWMFEIDGVRFGDGYTYPFEHGGSGGLEWIQWCSAFSGGGNGYFRVDDIEFYIYKPKITAPDLTLLHHYDFEEDIVGQDPTGLTLSVIEPVGSGTSNVDNLVDIQQNHVAVYKSGGTERVELRDNISYYGVSFDAGVFHCKIHHDDSLFGILFHDDLGVLFR